MSESDRELLELAAKACSLEGYIHEWINGPEFIVPGENPVTFNSLQDYGDALRLAAKLRIRIEWVTKFVVLCNNEAQDIAEHNMDAAKAMCYGITRAAAEIGKAMP